MRVVTQQLRSVRQLYVSPSSSPPMSERMRKLRESLFMSQGELAEALGVTQQTVSKWESGKAVPSKRTLGKLEQILGLRSGDLFVAAGWLEAAPPPNQTKVVPLATDYNSRIARMPKSIQRTIDDIIAAEERRRRR